MALKCPVSLCGAENDALADHCERCGVPLSQYARVQSHGARLFNQGLEAARESHLLEARDVFSSFVHWHPLDIEARNCLAAVCLALGDRDEARTQWSRVLQASERDVTAAAGIASLDEQADKEKSKPGGAAGGARPRKRKGGKGRKGRKRQKKKRPGR